MPIEVIGDSARGDAYAFVRLLVEGERIVEADAPGIARPLAGLTLLDAAAVPGEVLATDALANAIASVFTASPRTPSTTRSDPWPQRPRTRGASPSR